jgi:hypothetical protein
MTSRRSFLLSCSSVPFLSMTGHFAVAKPFKQSQFSGMGPTQPDADFSQAEMGIYGWHTPQTDTAQTHLICLSASWKADWL